ncbi:hypothetical protein CONPUDRAFT_165627 [Coniophora puteana RWD-64-598 SS2]|uniref:F-box domain-containing protein n=1 Tax=Coniophora puteana (strain RWD-64-598) TaxID=741705 RepID=A0A5M3MRY2_CONPW|nr:uncharacterized protein CONPUDRAFT_165627 [Coniophora puteana RWD-64-598 SS2]EIW81504.1 hypothetical protein CONPUDRAFT_165627 [Coniophora puteana RWD-64-598 SS2]
MTWLYVDSAYLLVFAASLRRLCSDTLASIVLSHSVDHKDRTQPPSNLHFQALSALASFHALKTLWIELEMEDRVEVSGQQLIALVPNWPQLEKLRIYPFDTSDGISVSSLAGILQHLPNAFEVSVPTTMFDSDFDDLPDMYPTFKQVKRLCIAYEEHDVDERLPWTSSTYDMREGRWVANQYASDERSSDEKHTSVDSGEEE